MNRLCLITVLIICCVWSCNKESLQEAKPLTEDLTPSTQLEWNYDRAKQDLNARIKLSEMQLRRIKKNDVVRDGRTVIMSPQEPMQNQNKAVNPPE